MSIIITIVLWIIALIIFLTNPKNKVIRMASILAISCGSGGLTEFFSVNIEKWSTEYGISLSTLIFIQALISKVSHYIGAYSVLAYGLVCLEVYKNNNKKRKLLFCFLFVPVLLSYIFFPYKSSNYLSMEENKINFIFLSLWAVPYIFMGNVFMIMRWKKEKVKSRRNYWLLNAIIVVPFTTGAIFSNFLLRIFGIEKTWNIFIVLVPIQFVLFIVFAVKNGVLGVRIKFEKYNLAVSKVFNHISDSIIIINENLDIVEVNDSFRNNFGNCSEYENLVDALNNTLLKTYIKKILFVVENREKKIIPISVGKNYYDLEVDSIVKNNVFHGVFIIGKNVTEHKNNLILLKNSQNQIIENRRYDTFVSLIGGIAHNLKTPVMTSLGGIEILKRETSKIENNINKDFDSIIKKQYKWENIIKLSMENVSRAIKLIQDQSAYKKNYSLSDIEKELRLFLNFELLKNGCVLVTNFNVQSNIRIEGTIIHILNNLIINSIHSYSESNKSKNIIELNIDENVKEIFIKVVDYGVGISDEVKTQIFKGMITTKGNSGSGLGLYITNILVKAKLGGSLWFKSEFGKGTTFFISISK